MEYLSVFDLISNLFNIIVTSPFFISLFIILILTIAVLLINIKINKPIIKIVVGIIYFVISIFVILKYFPSLGVLMDSIVDKIFLALYFPNYISYLCMLIVAVLLFVKSILDHTLSRFAKVVNVVAFLIMVFLFILSLDIITKNDIDITLRSSVYSNETLLVLIEATTLVFAIWIVASIVDMVAVRIMKNDNRKKLDLQKKLASLSLILNSKNELESITDKDFTFLSEENFYEGYGKVYKKKQYDDYKNIVSSDDD